MPDKFDLLPDGRVALGWGDYEVTLRRPLISQWAAYYESAIAADAWRQEGEEVVVAGETKRRVRPLVELAKGPYVDLYRTIVSDLGDKEAPEEFPLWLVDGGAFVDLNTHWMERPLPRGAAGPATANS